MNSQNLVLQTIHFFSRNFQAPRRNWGFLSMDGAYTAWALYTLRSCLSGSEGYFEKISCLSCGHIWQLSYRPLPSYQVSQFFHLLRTVEKGSKVLEGSAIFVSILSPQVTMANVLWLNSPFKVGCNNLCNAILDNFLKIVLDEITSTYVFLDLDKLVFI